MEYKNLVVENDNAIAKVMINRPEKLNVLDIETLKELDDSLNRIAKDEKCRVVIISGMGEKAFCAGADISLLSSLSEDNAVGEFADRIYKIDRLIETMEKPVIAAIHGYCLGGGCELAIACDIRIAASDSKLGQPEVHIGIMPGGGGTFRLPRIVGLGKAKEMIFTGTIINADEALRIGLVNMVVETGKLLEEAVSMAIKINENSFNALREAKKAINAAAASDNSAERAGFIACFKHADSKEGIRAFLEHRKPKFV